MEGFSILIFPTSATLAMLCFVAIANGLDGYTFTDEEYMVVFGRIRTIMTYERDFEFSQKNIFLLYFAM